MCYCMVADNIFAFKDIIILVWSSENVWEWTDANVFLVGIETSSGR